MDKTYPLYIVYVIFNLWFTRNTIANWFNKSPYHTDWKDVFSFNIKLFIYFCCFIVPMGVFHEYKNWTIKYIKLKNNAPISKKKDQ